MNSLALLIQSLLRLDSKGTTVDHSRGGASVDVSSQELIAKKPRIDSYQSKR